MKAATSGNGKRDAGDGTRYVLIAFGLSTSCVVREAMIQVRVKLFATLCRYFGNALPGIPFEVEMPERATLSDLLNFLKLPHEEVKVFFVNGRARPIDWRLEPGDEIGIFPLVAGG